MKNIYVIVFGLLLVMSCDKKDQTAENSVKTEKSTEVSQVQEPMKIKNDKGEEIANSEAPEIVGLVNDNVPVPVFFTVNVLTIVPSLGK